MALPQKTKHWLHLWSRNSTSRYIPKRFKVGTWLDICMLVFIAASHIITKVLIAQSCLTLCSPMSCNLPDCPWNSPGKEYWSGLPCPFPGNVPDPGIKFGSSALQADSLPFEPPGKPIITKRWKQHTRPLTDERVNKMWYITQWSIIHS